MDYAECSKAALQFIKKRKLIGADLAEKARTFDNLLGSHAQVLKNEYKSDYQQEWPGCSETDQWSAVNWNDQVYVNSKDPNIITQCNMKRAGALAGLMSHEIFHVKAGSNYCANERNCLFKHELLAHMYERLVQKDHDGDASTKALVTTDDIEELSKQVFRNYIEQSVDSNADQEYRRLYSDFLNSLKNTGWRGKNIGVHDIDLMIRVGKNSLLSNQFYNGKKASLKRVPATTGSFLFDSRNEFGRGYRSTKLGVFYDGKQLAESDPITFEVLGNGYARDAQQVYFEGRGVGGVKQIHSFRVLHGSVATDNSDVFVRGAVLRNFPPLDSIAGSRQRSAARQRNRRLRATIKRKVATLLKNMT